MSNNNTTDWLQWAPTDPSTQESLRTETQACISFSAIHILEILSKYRGQEIDYSERALAALSGTTPQGNSFAKVFETLNTQPLLLQQNWPIPNDNYTWAEFYQSIPQNLLDSGIHFKFQWHYIQPSQVESALKIAPLWTEIRLSPTVTHAVALLNPTTYFDSYSKLIKPLTQPVLNYWLLTYMSNVKLIKNGSEYAFYVPATNEQALIDKALNFSYNLPTLNNGANVDWNNVKPDYTSIS